MQITIPIKKICQYYGAFSLTCKIIDAISPKPAEKAREWVEKLEKKPYNGHMDRAIQISPEMLMAKGEFFLDEQAVEGWYCIKSSDPEKKDLYLPPHIFRKSFRYVESRPIKNLNEWHFVVERVL